MRLMLYYTVERMQTLRVRVLKTHFNIVVVTHPTRRLEELLHSDHWPVCEAVDPVAGRHGAMLAGPRSGDD